MTPRIVGYIVWKDRDRYMEPLADAAGTVRLFSTMGEAQDYQGCLDVVAPISGARFRELCGEADLSAVERGER